MVRNDSNMQYRYFVDMAAARRAADNFSPHWLAVLNDNGLIMVDRITRRMVSLVVGEHPVTPCLVSRLPQ